jgi:predicted DNA-binding protein with PD1-like motif
MNYKKFDKTIIMRIDKGEELISTIVEVAKKENIALASVSGIGAVNHIELGLFNTLDKIYSKKEFRGDFEIVSLCGNISTMNDETYVHLHMAISDNKQYVYGGHLSKAIVSATVEIIIEIINGKIDRNFDPDTGLNLIKFE